jgi:hypothetical protein
VRVTLTADAVARTELLTLRFGTATNGLVDVPRGPSGSPGGFTVTLALGTRQATFVVRRATAGQGVSVPLTVVDGCRQ